MKRELELSFDVRVSVHR